MVLVVLTILGAAASSVVLAEGLLQSESAAAKLPSLTLPAGCVRPAGGFLIIASEYGYNDSVLEGAGPSKLWPVITVVLGQQVKITVCNVDTIQAHGFQIANYLDKSVEAISPGKVFSVTFTADKAGDFSIYCAIFCTIHIFMTYGMLKVTS
jgi:FtsP/CotA-like multicopper oxidase with cupredoxin domain